jgi:hypothetical protein
VPSWVEKSLVVESRSSNAKIHDHGDRTKVGDENMREAGTASSRASCKITFTKAAWAGVSDICLVFCLKLRY